jgi:regulator of sigma E protease
MPLSLSSPLSIAGLGLAYHVETVVEEVKPGSPAEKAGLKKNDVIKEFQFYKVGKTPDEVNPEKMRAIESHQWANVDTLIQEWESKKLTLKVDRDNTEITLTAEEDKNWPAEERGLFLIPDDRLYKASSLGEALGMGVEKTTFFIDMIFGNLRGIITKRLSSDNFGGIITISRFAFYTASENIYKFLVFLGIIGVNLAVVNFLPIPVLDGGHMMFLIYERIRGKPAPEQVRLAATLVGVAIVVCLLLFTTYLDLKRLF